MSNDIVQVEDAFAIRRLCERYAQAVDSGDSDEFVKDFTPDGHLVAHQGETSRISTGATNLLRFPFK